MGAECVPCTRAVISFIDTTEDIGLCWISANTIGVQYIYSKEPVPSGKSADIQVTYRAEHPEHFRRPLLYIVILPPLQYV